MDKLIYDIGMHTGRDTEFYLKKGFKVVAIEANPAHVESGKIKFKDEIANGRLTIINKAIAPDEDSEIEFYINSEKDDWGTILPDWNRSMKSDFKSIKVKTTQLETIIKEHGTPYFVKIDIEGADVLCLKSLLKANITPEFISIELLTPDNFKGKKVDSLEILFNLYAMGYRNFQVSDQSKNGRIKAPNPPLEGNYVDYKFGGDTSGLFGKELRTPKLSIDEISQRYLNYFYKGENDTVRLVKKALNKSGVPITKGQVFHSIGWFDVHASK